MIRRADGGFTLLEVMVTLAIVGIALVAILRSLAMSVDVSNESRNLSVATLLAKWKMAEIESQVFPDVGEGGGEFGDEYPGFRWETTTTETEVKELRKVAVTVLWQEGKYEKKLQLATLISQR
ncbi:MAG: type II secretion system minor pseudopilin GspI [Pseudomonadota bacterium]